jgi:rhodanese-related sulfurtransferase
MVFSLSGLLGRGDGGVPHISPADAKAMFDRGEAIIVDVREEAEVARTGKIPGALVIPVQRIAHDAATAGSNGEPKLDRNKAVIAYCASGARSAAAAHTLKQLGYETVFNLGGLRTWAAAGLPVER